MPDTNAEALGPPFVEMPALCICHNVNKGALIQSYKLLEHPYSAMPECKYWTGLDNIENLVVFGASYTQTVGVNEQLLVPSLEEPLGVPFPGTTYNEEGLPNWVGYLAKYRVDRPLLVWNYAKGGSQVTDVEQQVKTFLREKPHKFSSPQETCTDKAETSKASAERYRNTIFDPCERVNCLFDYCIAPLHDAGARKFLLFDNPPRMRASRSTSHSPNYEQHHQKIKSWNQTLWDLSERVERNHSGTSVFVFPTWDLFTDMFDNPEKYGFSSEDVNRGYGGRMWVDGLHPTSAVHKVIASQVVDLLS